MSGGGKGGSTTTVSRQEIPDWIKDPTVRNIERAEDIQQIGYMANRGLDVAALNPTQQAAGQMTLDTARTFGMLPQGQQNLYAYQGMPEPQVVDGVRGYSSANLYDMAVQAAAEANPAQAEQYRKLFV